MNSRLRLNQSWLPILLAALIILQVIEPSRVWMILLSGLGTAWLAAIFWVLSIKGSLHLRRETQLGWVRVGGQIDMRFTLSNISHLPAYSILFRDNSTLPGYDASATFNLGAGDFMQWNISVPCNRRGYYTFGNAELEISDPLGINRLHIYDSAKTSLLVLPHIIPLPSIHIRPAGLSGDGRPRPNMPEQIVNVSTVRGYTQGDSTRFIHWPTTARREELFVRVMEGAPKGAWWILLDLDQKYMAATGQESIEEQMVTLSASLADLGLGEYQAIGLIVNGDELAWLPPRAGEQQRWDILFALALARPSQTELGKLLQRNQSALGRNHSLILITASTKSDWIESLLASERRGNATTVFLFNPDSFDGRGSNQPTAELLQKRGVDCHLVERGMLPGPEFLVELGGEWSWHRTPTGQVVPLQIPASVQKSRGRR